MARIRREYYARRIVKSEWREENKVGHPVWALVLACGHECILGQKGAKPELPELITCFSCEIK